MNNFINEIKLAYPTAIVYMEFNNSPTLFIHCNTYQPNFGASYEIEVNSLHLIESDGDLIIEKCKQLYNKYRRDENLEKLLFNI